MAERIYNNILETYGNTPLVRISKMNKGAAEVLAKIESFNPGGSVKDRVGIAMIEEAEKALDIEELVNRCEINHQRLRLFPKK